MRFRLFIFTAGRFSILQKVGWLLSFGIYMPTAWLIAMYEDWLYDNKTEIEPFA